MRAEISRPAIIVFTIFIVIYYGLPFLTQMIFPGRFEYYFNMPNHLFFVLWVPAVFLLVLILDILLPRVTFNKTLLVAVGRLASNEYLNFVLALGFLVLALIFSSQYSYSFRHHVRFQEAGKLVMLVFGIKAYFSSMVFGLLLMTLNGFYITKFQRLINVLVLISMVLTATSSYDVLFILIILLFCIKLEKPIFMTKKSNGVVGFIKTNFKYLFVGVFGFLALFMGVANKYGVETSTQLLFSGEFFFLVIRRISMWYVSLQIAGESILNDLSISMEANVGLLQDIFRRFSIILGQPADKPEIWGINRMNHTIVYPVITSHAGSSPGLFATIFYIPFFPSGIVVVSLYIIFILRNFGDLLKYSRANLSLVSYPLLVLFLGVFFESPIEQINLIGKSFIYFIISLGWIFFIKHRMSYEK